MELKNRNLFIDTHYFVSHAFNFDSSELKNLKKLAEKKIVNVYLTDITVEEINKKISDEIKLSYAKLNHTDTRHLKTIPLFRKFLSTFNEQSVINLLQDNLTDFIEKCFIKIISSNEIKVLDIYKMYADLRPPFSLLRDKKKEFPDAFALETISNWCSSNGENTYILSGDNDWKSYAEQDKYTLTYLDNLPELMDALIRNQNDLIDLTAFADRLMILNDNKINTEIIGMLNRAEMEITTAEPEIIKIKSQEIISMTIAGKEITAVYKDSAAYTLTIEAETHLKCEVIDYENSVYDPDLDEYMYIHRETVYYKTLVVTECEIEISFEDSLPSNFEIDSLTCEDLIQVDEEELESLSIKTWVYNIPVRLQGVKNGLVTGDLSDSQEFENYDAAQRVFPKLDVWKECDIFSAAIGSIMGNNLTFSYKKYSI